MARKSRSQHAAPPPTDGAAARLASVGPLAFVWTTALVALLLGPIEAARYGFLTQPALAAFWPGDPAAELMDAAWMALAAGRLVILSAIIVVIVRLWVGIVGGGILSAIGAGLMIWAMSFGYGLSTLALLKLAPPQSLMIGAGITAAACVAAALLARWGLRPAAEADDAPDAA